MNILITNIWLSNHGGTEVYVRDLAYSLHKRGIHIEVYSPILGPIADEIKDAGILVTDRIEKLINKPDLIHTHHYIPSMDVISKFPNVPAIYFLHDRTHIIDTPPKHHQLFKYIAVDYNCLDRLLIDHRIDKEKTEVYYNWVDTSRFKLREEFSEKPLKALVFSNYAHHDNSYKTIQEACAVKGISLDGLGAGLGNAVKDPENILNNYDIIFAKAKAAMEALSTGAAVILCDFRGLGEMVTMENFDHFRKYNFGMKTLTKPIEKDLILDEIEKYKSSECKKTAQEIRLKASFELYLDKITNLYQTTIQDHLNHPKENNKESNRVIREYNHLKRVLTKNIAEPYKKQVDSLNELQSNQEILLEEQNKMIRNLENEIYSIKKSLSFKLGYLQSAPFRAIYELIKSKKDKP